MKIVSRNGKVVDKADKMAETSDCKKMVVGSKLLTGKDDGSKAGIL